MKRPPDNTPDSPDTTTVLRNVFSTKENGESNTAMTLNLAPLSLQTGSRRKNTALSQVATGNRNIGKPNATKRKGGKAGKKPRPSFLSPQKSLEELEKEAQLIGYVREELLRSNN